MLDPPRRLGDLSAEARIRLEASIDRFEEDWRRGERPTLASYLPDDPGERLTLLRELVLVESELRHDAGEHVLAETYLDRFPELRGAGIAEEIAALTSAPPAAWHEPRTTLPANPLPGSQGKTEPRSYGLVVPPVIPGYEVLEELGRGGMGVVYRARELRLGRPCALKMILAGEHAGPEAAARFLAEAGIVARLRHPNVVQVYAMGDHAGRPYFEMEYVEGGSLDRALDGTPWPDRRAAELVEMLSHGVAAAHGLNIIHRDLKPANVLLGIAGTPKITDFGLAKCLDSDAGLTRSESVIGSPGYMSPEQAQGRAKAVGPRADIYSLGAILYELLTGRPPFRAATVLETLELVKHAEPVAPSRLVPGLSRDAETICLKCLQKDPARRYASADALADDLRRFLAREPIRARPVGPFERLWRWARRRPAIAALTATVAALLVIVAVGGVVAALAIRQGAKAIEESLGRERDARRDAERALADMGTSRGLLADERNDPAQAALWFANAALQSRSDAERVGDNAIRVATWSRRAPQPIHALTHGGLPLDHLAFTADARYLLTQTDQRRLYLWDLESGSPLDWAKGDAPPGPAALSPQSRRIAIGTPEGVVEVRAIPSGEVVERIKSRAPIRALSFSADGHFLALADGDSARVWDFRTRNFATTELTHPAPITGLAFGPRGDRLATACDDGKARVFAVPADPKHKGPLFPPVRHGTLRAWMGTRTMAPLFADDGRLLVTLKESNQVTFWDVETGAEVRSLADVPGDVYAVGLSPDGRTLGLGGWCWAATWDVGTGNKPVPYAHRQQVEALIFSPDGKTLLSLCDDHLARSWTDPVASPMPLSHQSEPNLAAFSADGRLLATAQKDGLVRVWQLPRELVFPVRMPQDFGQYAARLSSDGRLAAPARSNTTLPLGIARARIYDTTTGRPVGPYLDPGGPISDIALAPDGRTVAVANHDPPGPAPPTGALSFWSTSDEARRPVSLRLAAAPERLAYSPEGTLLAVATTGDEALLVSPSRAAIVARLRHDEPPEARKAGPRLLFTPDGRTLITVVGRSARVWNVAIRPMKFSPLVHADTILSADVSRDSRFLATASMDGELRVWNLADGRLAAAPIAHDDWIFAVRFNGRGDRLAVACRDGSARVWDWRLGQLACSPMRHGDEVWSVAFTTDDRRLLTSSRDSHVRAWELRTGKPLTPVIPLEGNGCHSAEITPDGRSVVAGVALSGLVAFPLADMIGPLARDPDELETFGELTSGRRIHQGELVNLSTKEWLDRWTRAHPGPTSRDVDDQTPRARPDRAPAGR